MKIKPVVVFNVYILVLFTASSTCPVFNGVSLTIRFTIQGQNPEAYTIIINVYTRARARLHSHMPPLSHVCELPARVRQWSDNQSELPYTFFQPVVLKPVSVFQSVSGVQVCQGFLSFYILVVLRIIFCSHFLPLKWFIFIVFKILIVF